MHRTLSLTAIAVILLTAGCATTRTPTTATRLEPEIRAKVEKGIVEPGFTPEMVFLALGKPSEPTESLVDATTNGTWIYRDFTRDDRALVKAGFRRRVIFDDGKKTDVIKTEPIDTKATPNLQANSLYITFRDGRVVEIQRT
jgi:hypothetical protein